MAISDKIKNAIEYYNSGDINQSFEQAMIAADATSKKAYPELKIGRNKERMEKFFHDNMEMITGIGTNLLLMKNVTLNSSDENSGETIQTILYKYIRCSLLHETEIDQKIQLTENTFGCNDGKYIFPKAIVIGICMAIVGNSANKSEWIRNPLKLYKNRKPIEINRLWGKMTLIKQEFNLKY